MPAEKDGCYPVPQPLAQFNHFKCLKFLVEIGASHVGRERGRGVGTRPALNVTMRTGAEIENAVNDVLATIVDEGGHITAPLVPVGPHGLRLFREPPCSPGADIESLNLTLTVRHAGVLRTGKGVWIGSCRPSSHAVSWPGRWPNSRCDNRRDHDRDARRVGDRASAARSTDCRPATTIRVDGTGR